jgi:hypothetical protein
MAEKDDMILYLGIAIAIYLIYETTKSTDDKKKPITEPVKNPDKIINEYPEETKIPIELPKETEIPTEPPKIPIFKSGARIIGILGGSALITTAGFLGLNYLNYLSNRPRQERQIVWRDNPAVGDYYWVYV